MAIYKREAFPNGFDSEKHETLSPEKSPQQIGAQVVETLEAATNANVLGNVEITPDERQTVSLFARHTMEMSQGSPDSDEYILSGLNSALMTLPDTERDRSYASRLLKFVAGGALRNPEDGRRLVIEASGSAGANTFENVLEMWALAAKANSNEELGSRFDAMIGDAPDSESRASLRALAAGLLASDEAGRANHYIDGMESELNT